MNRFVTESEVEEAKKKRAEEWEAARSAGRELPNPEEPVDTRSLYEKLQEQKDKKQEVFEDQLKFKNMIYKGLNHEDAEFLGMVSKKQAELDDQRYNEHSEEMQQYRSAVDEVASGHLKKKEENQMTNKPAIADDFKTKKNKSQAALLMGGIIKKRKTDDDVITTPPKKSREEEKRNTSAEEEETKSSGNSLSILAGYSSSSSDGESEND